MTRYKPVVDFYQIPLNGGMVTITLDVDVFALSDNDRAFIFALADLVQARAEAST